MAPQATRDIVIRAAPRPGQRRLVYRCAAVADVAAGAGDRGGHPGARLAAEGTSHCRAEVTAGKGMTPLP